MGELLKTIFRLLIMSFFVGLILTFFDLRPSDLLHDTGAKLMALWRAGLELGDWAGPYVLTGAEVVVPIAIISLLFHWRRR